MSDLKVTVGQSAYVFHDQNTGVTVSKGEVVELNAFQASSKRVLQALNSGHLIRVESVAISKKDNEARLVDLRAKFIALYQGGKTPDKIASAFNADELKDLAIKSELTVESGDTKLDIVNAIIGEIEEEEE